MTSTRPDASPHTVATWYDWDDGRVLLNMDASRVRVNYLIERPAVALTVLDGQSWYRHVSLIGRIVEHHDDVDLADIDRLALRYTGSAYPDRGHRRISMWMARGPLARLGRHGRHLDARRLEAVRTVGTGDFSAGPVHDRFSHSSP